LFTYRLHKICFEKVKELTTEQKKLIVRLSEDNVSGPKISEILGINRFTIANFLKRYRMRENLENASRSGRPKLTDARTDRQLLRVVKLNHRKTLREATCVYNADT
jgi:transposase